MEFYGQTSGDHSQTPEFMTALTQIKEDAKKGIDQIGNSIKMYKNGEGDQIPEEADGILPTVKAPKIKKEDLPSTFYVVAWHVEDHAEGESFITLEQAEKFY